jgi:hypothetical protein
MSGVSSGRSCGRPTKKGSPCRREVHTWFEGLKVQRADGCWRHMSQAFREAAECRKQAAETAWHAYLYADPICWGWPTPGGGLVGAHTDALIRWQAGRCAICGHTRALVEDHDHVTGMVRGYLCTGCNIQEGIYRDPATLFGKYRERHPTQILGLRIRYWDPIAKDYAVPQPSQSEADKWTDAASEDIGL